MAKKRAFYGISSMFDENFHHVYYFLPLPYHIIVLTLHRNCVEKWNNDCVRAPNIVK